MQRKNKAHESQILLDKRQTRKRENKSETLLNRQDGGRFFTKPLQGSLFRKFRDVILGYKHITSLYRSTEEDSSTQKRVEGNDNGANVRPSVDKHHPTVVTWADVVREKVNDT